MNARALGIVLVVLLGLGLVAGALGMLVVLSGVVPIKASSGHWAITAWFLDFAKVRSVSMHALGHELPALDDPALVMQGAGSYESGCAPCHGAPGRRMPVILAAATPHPPALSANLARWDAEELFEIVKHGIKFTGMPAWPAQARDDEVHALVAFLLKLPELDAAGYRALVYGREPGAAAEPLALASAAGSCARCHGDDGLGRERPAFPKLAGQKAEYLERALRAYAEGRRHSGVMQPIAAALDARERAELALHYSKLAPAAAQAAPADAAFARGERIAREGLPEQGVPACSECHGPSPTRRNAAYPQLAGQDARYLRGQLALFAVKTRGGSPYAHLMERVASRLTPAQMSDAARYYAALAAEPDAR